MATGIKSEGGTKGMPLRAAAVPQLAGTEPEFFSPIKRRALKPGRPSYQATEKDRRTVREMTAYGIDQDAIARVLGISKPTIRRHFRQEIDTAAPEAVAMVAGSLFQQAMGSPDRPPNVAAAIFYLKVRGRWSEPNAVVEAKKAKEKEEAEDTTDLSKLTDAKIASEIKRLTVRRPHARAKFGA